MTIKERPIEETEQLDEASVEKVELERPLIRVNFGESEEADGEDTDPPAGDEVGS